MSKTQKSTGPRASSGEADPLAFDNPTLHDTHYFDQDAMRMTPRIANTDENWENRMLGADERYAVVAPALPVEVFDVRR
jgi:hypothetical protein